MRFAPLHLAWRLTFAISLLLVTVGSLLPTQQLPDLAFDIWDKAQHAAGFGWLMFCGLMSHGWRDGGWRLVERAQDVVRQMLARHRVRFAHCHRIAQRVAQPAIGVGGALEDLGPDPLVGTVWRVEPFGRLQISALGVEEQRVNVPIWLGIGALVFGGILLLVGRKN